MSSKNPIEFKVAVKDFYRYLAKMQKELGYSLDKAVAEGAKLFSRSAARWTPPEMGRKIPRYTRQKHTDLFNRRIIPVVFERKTHAYLPQSRQRELIGKNGHSLKRGAGKRLGLEFVVRSKIPGTRRYQPHTYSDYGAAKSAAVIHTRGLLRAGWWGNVLNLGGTPATLNETYGDRVMSLVRAVSRLIRRRTDTRAEITLVNAVREANSDAGKRMGVTHGLQNAGTAMKNIVARKANELKKIPF